jgi:hypothetical protein
MLVLKLELWKGGNPNDVEELGRTYIHNVGCSQDHKRGDYEVLVARKGYHDHHSVFRGGKVARTGEVKNYPRLSYNVWRLIIRALLSAFPEEKAQ